MFINKFKPYVLDDTEIQTLLSLLAFINKTKVFYENGIFYKINEDDIIERLFYEFEWHEVIYSEYFLRNLFGDHILPDSKLPAWKMARIKLSTYENPLDFLFNVTIELNI